MEFVPLNCPNCSAAVDVGRNARSAKCSYCGTTFVPRSPRSNADPQSNAAERTASELALRRLHHERRRITRRLKETADLHWSIENGKIGSREAQIFLADFSRSEKIDKAKEIRNGFFSLGFLGFLFGWIFEAGWLWWMFVVGLFGAVVAHVTILSLGKAQSLPPVHFQPYVPSDEDKRLEQQLAGIESEIAYHRRIVARDPIFDSDD